MARDTYSLASEDLVTSGPPPLPGGASASGHPAVTRPAMGEGADERSASEPTGRPPRRADVSPNRLASLDAYRGLIMLLLMSGGFGIGAFAALPESDPVWRTLDREVAQQVAFHFEHPPWRSRFGLLGVSLWDLIQPAFMLMVGVSVPFSLVARRRRGETTAKIWTHTIVRCVILVLLGVFLRSVGYSSTRWEFVNVLAQIGLGYWVVVLLAKQKPAVVFTVAALILTAYGLLFYVTPAPEDYDFAANGAVEGSVFDGLARGWSMNGNLAHRFDVWLLNLFERPDGLAYVGNPGGYQTLNFVPSIATMLIGLVCGQILLRPQPHSRRLLKLAAIAAVTLSLGVVLDVTCCPIVKRIWTPSWTLYSAGWTVGMLAVFYLLCDVARGRSLFLPLIVIGMNSLLMYLLGQLADDWTAEQIRTHLSGLLALLTPDGWTWERWVALCTPFLVVGAFWLLAAYLYRLRIFLRI